MSRSYRAPWVKDGYGTNRKRYNKRQASRRVRYAEDVPNGKAYRKFYDPWDICDYRWRHNPNPRYYSTHRGIEVVEPDPEWRVRRK